MAYYITSSQLLCITTGLTYRTVQRVLAFYADKRFSLIVPSWEHCNNDSQIEACAMTCVQWNMGFVVKMCVRVCWRCLSYLCWGDSHSGRKVAPSPLICNKSLCIDTCSVLIIRWRMETELIVIIGYQECWQWFGLFNFLFWNYSLVFKDNNDI